MKNIQQQGQVMISLIIGLVIVSTAVTVGSIVPTVKTTKSLQNDVSGNRNYYLAEAGIEDVLFRLKKGFVINQTEETNLDGLNIETEITDTTSGKRLITRVNKDNYSKAILSEVVAGTGISFHYGVHIGQGGLTMSNNSTINGNVYSHGDIIGSNGARITGSAIAANSSALVTDQSNDTPGLNPEEIIFRNSTASQDIAQSFIIEGNDVINKVEFYLKKVGNPANATVVVVNDNNGVPGSTVLASGALNSSLVTNNFGWTTVTFSSNPNLNPNTTYWLVIDSSSNSNSNYYVIGANNNGYQSGQSRVGRWKSSWSTSNGFDLYFRIYLGGVTSKIHNVIVGDLAHANTVTNSNISGELYCQSGSANNKICNSSLTDPVPQTFPVSEANILSWKDDATSGGLINGNYSVSGSQSTIGPVKINGNLTVTNNHVLTLSGVVWVTGNINISNNAIVRLSSDYGSNSGLIITDGTVSVSNNANFTGSGQSGSYIMVLTTSDSQNAINVSNNAGTVVLNAQNGSINFANNSGAKAAVAREINISNNAQINYETGLVNLNFVSGPSGGWNILNWEEVE